MPNLEASSIPMPDMPLRLSSIQRISQNGLKEFTESVMQFTRVHQGFYCYRLRQFILDNYCKPAVVYFVKGAYVNTIAKKAS